MGREQERSERSRNRRERGRQTYRKTEKKIDGEKVSLKGIGGEGEKE